MFQLQILTIIMIKNDLKNNMKLNKQLKPSSFFYLYERPELTKFFDIDG